MIFSKIYDKNDSKLIAEKYVEWLNNGISPDEILVLTFNSDSKKNIIKNILNLTQNKVLSDIKIHTFGGLIYNSVLDNWGTLENKIKDKKTLVLPHLSGLEISQYILKQIIKEEEVKGYNSKKSLLHQIFRRYSLIVKNNLTPDETEKKSKILGEAFCDDAEKIIQNFRAKTVDVRAFDNIRQAQIFAYIYSKTDYFKKIKYLISEDTDELTPLAFDFIKTIAPQLKDKLIFLDENGGSRCGYLCAEPQSKKVLEDIFNEKITDNITDSENIIKLKNNILNDEKNNIENIKVFSLSKRVDMTEKTTELINNLIKSGIKPKDISIITPVQDTLLKFSLKTGLKNCEPIFISGNEKLADNPLVKSVISILKLSINLPIDEYELRIILSKFLEIPIKNLKKILEHYKCRKELIEADLGDDIYNKNIKYFYSILEQLKSSNLTLSEKAYYTYINLLKTSDKYDLAKFNFFLKELQDFEKIFKNEQIENFEEEILTQMENSIISENPYATFRMKNNQIIVGTPQKIIDNKIKTTYQFWLDTSSNEWIKSDIGPLYNSWVFQKNWDKEVYTIEDNILLSKEKTFKILRKLMLNGEKFYTFSSLFDTQGVENIGGIDKYLIPEENPDQTDNKKAEFKIIPRADQKPILEYEKGRMAISAVPGAGKTTILLALIIELLKKGINPEKIYVLTYMESAARNFKDKIKGINVDSNGLPNISTIHGLALRILKENSNYERVGLNPDFDICDDARRSNIIRAISQNIPKQESDEFERAISILKLSGADTNPETNSKIQDLLKITKGNSAKIKLSNFLKFFCNYQKFLENNNLIDYDDILISAVKLLEKNSDILEYYQNLCEYIIEDEAQDSSSIQQRLITLLSQKHGNLIRCGDINQAITTTFTNADVKGFKNFIETSNCVNMNHSQRCSKGVWELANKLVKYGNSKLKTPFYEIYMHPVEDKNPTENNPLYADIYNTMPEEKIGTVKRIKEILSEKPDSTIGILLRNNYQVNNWADYINNSGLTAITRNECLGQKKIFKVIFSILKFISEPFDNLTVAKAYKTLSECGFFKLHLENIITNLNDELMGNYTDFISLKNDELKDADLAKFHWDMNYWLSFPELDTEDLALKIGFHYFSESIDKSNIHLIATLCSRLDGSTFVQTVQKLEDLSQRPTLSGFKFFSEEDEKDMLKGKIQIMTLHKSKGDEFDYVFLPEMSEKNLTLDISQLELKKSSDFSENVRSLNSDYTPKTADELKLFLISENYRLLYVAITRARKRLYISASEKEISYGKLKASVPSIIFQDFFNK